MWERHQAAAWHPLAPPHTQVPWGQAVPVQVTRDKITASPGAAPSWPLVTRFSCRCVGGGKDTGGLGPRGAGCRVLEAPTSLQTHTRTHTPARTWFGCAVSRPPRGSGCRLTGTVPPAAPRDCSAEHISGQKETREANTQAGSKFPKRLGDAVHRSSGPAGHSGATPPLPRPRPA